MKSIQYNSHGSDFDSMLQLVETDDIPTNPPQGFAVVKIHVAAGNPIDVMVAKGLLDEVWKCPLPMTVGYDFSGEIVSADESSGFLVGDEVFAVNWGQNSHATEDGAIVGGAFADYITIPLNKLSKKPAELSHEKAAALALVGSTAFEALFDCLKVKKGDKILIFGGPTAVGSIAIQLAKNAGAWVATTTSERNMDHVKSLKPDLILDYRKEDWANHSSLVGLDAVFDTVGEKDAFAKITAKDNKVVKAGGRFVSISSHDAGFNPEAHKPRLEFGAFFCLYNSPEVQDRLAADVVQGKVKIDLDKTYEFSKAGAVEMFHRIESGKSRGKNVMKVVV